MSIIVQFSMTFSNVLSCLLINTCSKKVFVFNHNNMILKKNLFLTKYLSRRHQRAWENVMENWTIIDICILDIIYIFLQQFYGHLYVVFFFTSRDIMIEQ